MTAPTPARTRGGLVKYERREYEGQTFRTLGCGTLRLSQSGDQLYLGRVVSGALAWQVTVGLPLEWPNYARTNDGFDRYAFALVSLAVPVRGDE